jgi:cyclic pyranopterin phosphate synthase
MTESLTHLDQTGEARMVDVGSKTATRRRAVVEGFVRCNDALLERIRADDLAKGSVLRIAQIAGIQAAKRTDELIPLCHTIPLDDVDVQLDLAAGGVRIRAEAKATWTTGVEMEAFTAVMAAALTVIDMGKAVDKAMVVQGVRLIEKTGGRSGTYRAQDAAGAAHQPQEESR